MSGDGAYAVVTALWEAKVDESRVQYQHGLQVKYGSKQTNKQPKTSKLLETKLYATYPVSLRNMQRGSQNDRNGFK